jgi:hypothetical protein
VFFVFGGVFMQAVAIEDADRNTDEHEIISAAQKGDTEAIEYLLKKYKRIVLACVRYYFLPGAEKEDLIQEGVTETQTERVITTVRVFTPDGVFDLK